MASEAGAIGHKALAEVDRLLAEKPDKVGHDFSEATRCLAAYRDALIAQLRTSGAEGDRGRLEQVNSVLSAVIGGHFPIGSIPWEHIEGARDVLAKLVTEGATQEPAQRIFPLVGSD